MRASANYTVFVEEIISSNYIFTGYELNSETFYYYELSEARRQRGTSYKSLPHVDVSGAEMRKPEAEKRSLHCYWANLNKPLTPVTLRYSDLVAMDSEV